MSRLNLEEALATFPDWQADISQLPQVVEPITRGLTNRNFLIRAQGVDYVLRLNNPADQSIDIDRNSESVALQQAYEAGFAPKPVYCSQQQGVLVTAHIAGRHWGVEDAGTESNLHRIATLLREVHGLPTVNAQLNPEDKADKYWHLIKTGPGVVPEELRLVRQSMVAVFQAREEGARCFCHNDPSPPNLIDDGAKLWLIDWEYAAMGDPFFDLACVAWNFGLDDNQISFLLTRYKPEETSGARLFNRALATYLYLDLLWYGAQGLLSDKLGDGQQAKLNRLKSLL